MSASRTEPDKQISLLAEGEAHYSDRSCVLADLGYGIWQFQYVSTLFDRECLAGRYRRLSVDLLRNHPELGDILYVAAANHITPRVRAAGDVSRNYKGFHPSGRFLWSWRAECFPTLMADGLELWSQFCPILQGGHDRIVWVDEYPTPEEAWHRLAVAFRCLPAHLQFRLASGEHGRWVDSCLEENRWRRRND